MKKHLLCSFWGIVLLVNLKCKWELILVLKEFAVSDFAQRYAELLKLVARPQDFPLLPVM